MPSRRRCGRSIRDEWVCDALVYPHSMRATGHRESSAFIRPAASMDIMVLGCSVVCCFLYEMAMGSGGTTPMLSIPCVDVAISGIAVYSSSIISHLCSLRFIPPALSFISLISCPCFMLSHAFVSSPLCSLCTEDLLFSFCGGLFCFEGGSEALSLGCLLDVRSCERAAFRLSCPWAWNWPGRDG
ncbi:hypothetical protein B0H13DRAFT_2086968, partial [Mycena leptocephala]